MFGFHRRSALRGTPRPPARTRLEVEPLEVRSLLSANFLQTNLVSDLADLAQIEDPTLVNPAGIAVPPTSGAFSVSVTTTGLGGQYVGDVNGLPLQPLAFTVVVAGESPTGQVFNSSTEFTISDGVTSQPAVFLFATRSGVISGWHPNVGPQIPVGGETVAAETQTGFVASDDAVYTGLAMGQVGSAHFLYAADFHNSKIDVVDGQFQKVALAGNFTDPDLPTGFAPFNVQVIGGKLYVAYAKADAARDGGDQPGPGNGFIDVFETNGRFAGRLVTGGDLNSPWGLVQAPATFGDFGNSLLVGNFGDGTIHAFNATTGQELGAVLDGAGQVEVIPGLRGLVFGNGHTAGDANKLYFTAAPANGEHGLFGSLTAATTTTVAPTFIAVGAGAGGGPAVRVFDAAEQLHLAFFAYEPAFTGGVRVAVGDVNGDGTGDIITGPGPGGGPDIHIYDGTTGTLLRQFFAFNPGFTGGTFVAAGDVNGDGAADVIVGADAGGGPDVAIFIGRDGSRLDSFFAFDANFLGGVRVAAGDVNGDGRDDLIAAAGPGGGPSIVEFSLAGGSRQFLFGFFAFSPTFTGGVEVAAADTNGDGVAEILAAAGSGGAPAVSIFDARDAALLQTFLAYDRAFSGGVHLSAVRQGPRSELLTGPGTGGGPDLARFRAADTQTLDHFFALDPSFTGGLFVAG